MSKLVFANPMTGRPYQNIRKAVKKALKKAGLEGVWLHDLRRSFITHARKAGVPESVVMRMSGHKTRAVFDRYNIVDDDDVRQAAQKVEAARLRQDLGKVPAEADSENTEGPTKPPGLQGLTK